jgi:hypothetical protein
LPLRNCLVLPRSCLPDAFPDPLGCIQALPTGCLPGAMPRHRCQALLCVAFRATKPRHL